MRDELNDPIVDTVEDFYEHSINMDDIESFDMDKDFEKKKEFVEENLWAKLEKFGKKISFAKDILALFRYMQDPNVPWYRKSIVVGALIYFIVPIDAVPDLIPLVGYLDDLGVITAVLKFLGHELIPYYDK
ncbi:MAG: DUF1232 domain-containing protein [Chlorobi bacterium]|nr:DUF1232 domain-containing protein [Chlorobiota bacterium]